MAFIIINQNIPTANYDDSVIISSNVEEKKNIVIAVWLCIISPLELILL